MVDAFRQQRAYGLIPIVAMLAAFYLLLGYTSAPVLLVNAIYWAGLVAYLAWSHWFTRMRLARLDLPRPYLRQFGVARAVQYLGIGVLLAALIRENVL
nr:hypothetical protein [Gammaproteobacteria bacterium]